MFGQEGPQRFLPGCVGFTKLALQELAINGITEIRIHHRKVFGAQMALAFDHLGRVLEDHRHKARVVNLSVPDVAGVSQLFEEYAGGGVV